MILTRILTLIFVGGFATGAAAKGLSQPWTPAYRGASNAPAQVPQSYADTHYLLSSALLQRVSQAEIAAARGLVDAALLVDPVRLPDGSTLAGLPAATQGADLYLSHDVGFVPCSILAARSFRVKALGELPRLADPK